MLFLCLLLNGRRKKSKAAQAKLVASCRSSARRQAISMRLFMQTLSAIALPLSAELPPEGNAALWVLQAQGAPAPARLVTRVASATCYCNNTILLF